jgi:hypothetical protein
MGILFILLLIVGFSIGGETPDVNDSARKVVSFYKDNDTEQVIAASLVGLACVAFLFFLGALRQALRLAAPDGSGLPTVCLAGGMVMVVGMSLFAGLTFTAVDAAGDVPPSAIQAINALNSDLFITLVVGTAVFNLALGLSILRHRGLARWLGWLAVLLGIVALTPLGFFGFLATGIVVLAASILLLRAPAADGVAPGPPGAVAAERTP